MAQLANRRAPPPSLRGARVLVVEDDAILAMELALILRDAGADIAGPCGTVAEALAVSARTLDIAAAVLDVRLGRETIAPVARLLASHGTPFVFCTGQIARDPTLADWPDCRIIAKPADASALVGAVADLLSSPRSGQPKSHAEPNTHAKVFPEGAAPASGR